MKQTVVIAYDIVDDRRRQKVSEILEGYGVRVNYSVFECILSKAQLKYLLSEISAIINHNEDRVMYYPLCHSCFRKTLRQGAELSDHGDIVDIV